MQAVQHVELGCQHVMSAVRPEEAPGVSQRWQKEREGRRLRQEERVIGSHQNAPASQTAVRGRRGLGRLRLASRPGRGGDEAADHRVQAYRFADLGVPERDHQNPEAHVRMRRLRDAIQSLERDNRTLQKLQEKSRSEKVGSWGPSYCNMTSTLKARALGRIGTRRTLGEDWY